MKNCLKHRWYHKLIAKWFGIIFTCDHRCQGANEGAPCQYPNDELSEKN
jgi:hypothetical protein